MSDNITQALIQERLIQPIHNVFVTAFLTSRAHQFTRLFFFFFSKLIESHLLNDFLTKFLTHTAFECLGDSQEGSQCGLSAPVSCLECPMRQAGHTGRFFFFFFLDLPASLICLSTTGSQYYSATSTMWKQTHN